MTESIDLVLKKNAQKVMVSRLIYLFSIVKKLEHKCVYFKSKDMLMIFLGDLLHFIEDWPDIEQNRVIRKSRRYLVFHFMKSRH